MTLFTKDLVDLKGVSIKITSQKVRCTKAKFRFLNWMSFIYIPYGFDFWWVYVHKAAYIMVDKDMQNHFRSQVIRTGAIVEFPLMNSLIKTPQIIRNMQ